MANLFDICNLHGLALQNRMVTAPVTRTYATVNRVPTDLMRTYYVQRASAGLLTSECIAVYADSVGVTRAPAIYTDAQVNAWRQLTKAVHAADGRIVLQVWHGGRGSLSSLQPRGKPSVAPSSITASGEIFTPEGCKSFPVPCALGTAEITLLVEASGRTAASTQRAGFDGVELHGAFGYLQDHFLQDGTNTRTDAFDDPVANRVRFLLEAMAGAWSADRVGVKLSATSRFYGQTDRDTPATFGHVACALDAMRTGHVYVMEPSSVDIATATVQIEHATEVLRPRFPGVMITNGGYDKAEGNAVLASGVANLVSFGVLFVASPDLVEHFRRDTPLNSPESLLFYGEGLRDYTGHPALAA